ncbi:MAG: hypothetical protein ACTIJ9_02835 [Aequorivita sp.]
MKTKIINPLLLLIFINLMFVGCQEVSDDQEPGPVKPPQQIISVERATEMYDNYSSRRVPSIKKYEDSIASDTAPFTPTRYAEYDLETIKQYVAYVEYQAKLAKVDVKTLRFYLSNYPNSEKFANGDKVRYPRRNSLFVLPTMEYKGENVGFSIEEIDGKYSAVAINKSHASGDKNQNKAQNNSDGQLNKAGFFISNSAPVQLGTASLILNDGNLMPPPPINDFGNNN